MPGFAQDISTGQFVVDPDTMMVKAANTLPTRWGVVVSKHGDGFMAESRFLGEYRSLGVDAALRVLKVDPDTLEVKASADLTCLLGKATDCAADGTWSQTSKFVLQLNLMSVVESEDVCGGHTAILVGTSGFAYYSGLNKASERLETLGMVQYD